ncbi:LysR family transcriptional regulator [Parasutterella secunda]|uniref:LysR family transcriptional regulator n=1 Tax=Parasutterella secunda TaxID=626947 RepID=UPI0025A47C50|nr:LysR family transcriptional regulator [Parasutterella secunda]MDM8218761.1 LysR family transcriptional regulator [Parasutterella secunda]MDM8225518.1 LysR family transcriptional regulator [Parasutterella secunda]MDM8226581.1 LysR family transcriptional regulator [Parasutterella secunda]
MGLRIDEIRSFVAVAETGSFSAAARNLKRAQSVVSMHIAGFEAELGYKLFDRTPKPVLTAQGRELLVGAKRVLVEADRLQNRALTLSDTQSPSIYMGIDLVLEAPVMIDLLRLFAKSFPSVRLQIENISGSEAKWFFTKTAMNLALVFSSDPSLESDEYILGHSPLSIVVAKNHPLAAIDRPTVDDLRRYRQIVVHARDPQSPSPAVVNTDYWEIDSGLWALGLAARGVGWAILPNFLLIGQSAFRGSVVTINSPFRLEAQRLVLRSKKGEVSAEVIDWWAKTIDKNKTKLGLQVQ